MLSIASFRNNPINAVGILPTMISHENLFCGDFFNPPINLSTPSDKSIKLNINPLIRSIISFQKNVNMAINVPICNTVSNAKVVSTPSNAGTITKCPELLIGKNSANP